MEPKRFGFTGKSLRINLTSGEIKVVDISDQFTDWLGGSGFAAKTLFEETFADLMPFEPANKIIFSAGALVGTLAPGANKMNISTIGPVTGGWATGSSDSYVGIELKNAGYDNVIVEGRSRFPCYLWVSDEKVEIRDASAYWGLDTWQFVDSIREDLGDPSLHAVVIGPAGENLVRGACVIQDKYRAFGRCGTGAVMGSKNMKALICKGKKPISIADKETFLKVVKRCREKILNSPRTENFRKYGTLSCIQPKQDMCAVPYKNFQEAIFPPALVEKIDPKKMVDKYQIARQSFPGCVIGCGRFLEITDGPYSGLITQANQCEVVAGLIGKLAVEEPTFMFKVNSECNKRGLDVDFVAGTIAWAIECFQRGIITVEDTNGLSLEWGDEEVILHLLDMITNRDGFGNLLAEGCKRASEILKRGSEDYCIHIKGQELYETLRGSNAWALGAITSTRGGGHTTGAVVYEQTGPKTEDEKKIAREKFNIENFDQPQEYKGKPELVYYFEVLHRVSNSLGICHFNTIWQDLEYMDIYDIADLLSSATGISFTVEKLREIAMRQLNIEKAINIKLANFSREDDMPDERELFEAIPSGNLAGWKFDLQKLNRMLDEYYELHGWDKGTSYPTRKVLQRYGLTHVADELERIGKLGESTAEEE